MPKDSKQKESSNIDLPPLFGELSDAPTIFIDGLRGISSANGVIKVNLYQLVQDLGESGAPMKQVIVGRLAMSIQTYVQVADWLPQQTKLFLKEVS